MALIDDVAVVGVGVIGLNGESADAVRMTSIEAAQTAINATLAGLSTSDITNIDESGATPGQALIRNAANDGYELGDPSGAITSVDGEADVDTLTTGDGLTSTAPGAGQVELAVQFGTSATTVAAGNHTHRTNTIDRVPYSASGTLSSGSRTLASTNVALLAGVEYLVWAELKTCQRGNGGSSYSTLTLTIDGASRTSPEPNQCVGGVPDRPDLVYSQTLTGTGGTITVSAAINYSSGDPLTVDAGELIIHREANR